MLGRERPIGALPCGAVLGARVVRWLATNRPVRVALVAAPSALIALADASLRGARAVAAPAYAGSLALSVALWGVLLVLAARRHGAFRHVAAALFVIAVTLALGTQRYFHTQFGTYLNLDAVLFGVSFPDAVWRQLFADGATVARAHLLPLAVSIALVVAARALLRPRTRELAFARRLAPFAIAAPLFAPASYRTVQAAPPDVLALHALGGLSLATLGIRHHEAVLPGARTPEYLPALAAAPARPRNVVFFLNESVRADVVCSAPSADCPATPRTNAASPARIPLLQMRANDSITAVSVAVLLTGVASTESQIEMHRAPVLWEYARAAGRDTAYWTSQELRFANSDMFVREVGTATTIAALDLEAAPDGDFGADDRTLASYAEAHIGELREPFVLVIQLANTHFPYLVDETNAPFQPSERTKDPEATRDFYNFYRNSVFRQDAAVGRMLEAIHASAAGPRTVIVYTSDHGEAFREHGQVGHGLSIFDEELRVPFFVDAPEGTLSPAERAALVSLRDVPVFHADVLPTLLDLVGVHDAPELAHHRARFAGQSLLRPRAERAMAITNCAAVWGCPFKNWGMMRGSKKLEARAWDGAFHCFDVLADPGEQRDLGAAACGDLSARADAVFGGLPRDSR